MRVLYVDDEADIREVAQLAMSLTSGWEVRTAASGEAALRLLAEPGYKPDVMLLDVMMPQMDGPETFARARRLLSAEDLPVIFITARVLANERARLMALGAIGVIAKPFDPMRLTAEISAVLETHHG